MWEPEGVDNYKLLLFSRLEEQLYTRTHSSSESMPKTCEISIKTEFKHWVGGRHEMSYATKELLSIISCWETVDVFDLRVWSLGSDPISVKATPSRVYEWPVWHYGI